MPIGLRAVTLPSASGSATFCMNSRVASSKSCMVENSVKCLVVVGGVKAVELYRAAIASVTDKPVRYVVYHHDHADGITGMSVFPDTAQYVAHRLAAPKIAARKEPASAGPHDPVDDRKTLELGG